MHKKQSRMVPFIFGLILGILCMIYLPKYVRPYLPESMAKKETVLKGTVLAKENKGDALLLTVSTPEGALLATFKQKTGEIGRLINEKDEIQLTVPNYTPFIDEPKIIRVVKELQAVPATVEAPAAPAKPPAPVAKPRAKAAGPADALTRARQHLADGEFDKASKDYSTVIKKKYELDTVISDLRMAAEHFPTEQALWQLLGDAYMRADRLDEAVDAYNKGIQAA